MLQRGLPFLLSAAMFGYYAVIASCQSCLHEETQEIAHSYVREELVDYYVAFESRVESVGARRDVTIGDVTVDNHKVSTRERTVIEHYRLLDGVRKLKSISKVLTANREFDLTRGERSTFSREDFSSEMPLSGLEYFYLPMCDELNQLEKPTDGMVLLKCRDELTPKLTGEWGYSITNADAYRVVSGPFFLRSVDGTVSLSGTIRHKVSTEPFKINRTGGEVLVRLDPKDRLAKPLLSKFTSREIDQIKVVICVLKFRMAPIDSSEAREIDLPELLRSNWE